VGDFSTHFGERWLVTQIVIAWVFKRNVEGRNDATGASRHNQNLGGHVHGFGNGVCNEHSSKAFALEQLKNFIVQSLTSDFV
jgi:hypothetical protein